MKVKKQEPAKYKLEGYLGRWVKLSELAEIAGMSPIEFWLKQFSFILPEDEFQVVFSSGEVFKYVNPFKRRTNYYERSTLGDMTEKKALDCYIPDFSIRFLGFEEILLRRSDIAVQMHGVPYRLVYIFFLDHLVSCPIEIITGAVESIPVISQAELQLFCAGVYPDGRAAKDKSLVQVNMDQSVIGWVRQGSWLDRPDRHI